MRSMEAGNNESVEEWKKLRDEGFIELWKKAGVLNCTSLLTSRQIYIRYFLKIL